jgi:hypothetical protein
VLPIPVAFSPYTWKELGERLYYASDGRVYYIKRLMKTALEYALEDGEAQICPALLERAFTEAVWKAGIGALNPFNLAFKFRRLDRGSEPFQLGNSKMPDGKK